MRTTLVLPYEAMTAINLLIPEVFVPKSNLTCVFDTRKAFSHRIKVVHGG